MRLTEGRTMTFPVLHMNGTSADGLIDPLSNAYDALNTAYEALKQTAPNGRDYYVHRDPNALKTATEQHMARLRRVDEIKAELEEIIGDIQRQSDEKQQRRNS